MYKQRGPNNNCRRRGTPCSSSQISFCASQATIVLIVVLLQNCAIHRLLSATGSCNVLLSERSIGAAVVTKQRKVFGNLFGLLHLSYYLNHDGALNRTLTTLMLLIYTDNRTLHLNIFICGHLVASVYSVFHYKSHDGALNSTLTTLMLLIYTEDRTLHSKFFICGHLAASVGSVCYYMNHNRGFSTKQRHHLECLD